MEENGRCTAVMVASIELDLKQRLAKLSERDRLAMSAYLLRLKHSSKNGRREVSKLMKETDAGKKTGLSRLAVPPERQRGK